MWLISVCYHVDVILLLNNLQLEDYIRQHCTERISDVGVFSFCSGGLSGDFTHPLQSYLRFLALSFSGF